MAGELKALNPSSLFALGFIGFSGAFAFFLLRELFVDRGGFVADSLNLSAAVLLIVVCAISWPGISTLRSARFSRRGVALAVVACMLALTAQVPAYTSNNSFNSMRVDSGVRPH